jgi:hypothetical protein
LLGKRINRLNNQRSLGKKGGVGMPKQWQKQHLIARKLNLLKVKIHANSSMTISLCGLGLLVQSRTVIFIVKLFACGRIQ